MADTSTTEKPVANVVPLEGCDPVIGIALWVLEDARRRTQYILDELNEDWIDLAPPMGHNTLGSILYHMASTEKHWLYTVIGQTPPDDMQELFPEDDRDEYGALAKRETSTLETYKEKLALVRSRVLEIIKAMTLEEFRTLQEYTEWTGEARLISPERVVYHLVNHDAEHRGELTMIVEHFREQAANK